MGLKVFDIAFDNPYSTYYSGKVVSGKVKLTLDSPKKIAGILIRFKGEANNKWKESKPTRRRRGHSSSRTTTFEATEQYFDIKYHLLRSTTDSAEIELPTGTHTYPFTCDLPPTLPSSFEGERGHIRYTVKVTLERPWKYDHETKTAFTVISTVDLNLNPKAKEPIFKELTKRFWWCCFKSNPLTASIRLPASGYVSGQKIPVNVAINNTSYVNIPQINLIIRKIVTFHSQTPFAKSKQEKCIVAKESVGPCNGGETKVFNPEIPVPALPPSNLTNCCILDLDYELKIHFDVGGSHGLSLKIPIILGTIPLVRGNVSSASKSSGAPSNDSLPEKAQKVPPPYVPQDPGAWISCGPSSSGETSTSSDRNEYAAIPPPTYEESQFGTISIHDISDNEFTRFSQGAENYAPRYPVYQFPTLTPLPPK